MKQTPVFFAEDMTYEWSFSCGRVRAFLVKPLFRRAYRVELRVQGSPTQEEIDESREYAVARCDEANARAAAWRSV